MRISRKVRALVAVVIAVGALSLVAQTTRSESPETVPPNPPTSEPTSGTDDATPPEPPPPLDPVEDGALIDIYAEENGVTVDEALLRLEWQRLLPVFDFEVQRSLGRESYGGVWIDTETGRIQVGVVAEDVAVDVDTSVGTATESTVRDAADRVGLEASSIDIVFVEFSFDELVAGSSWLGEQLGKVDTGRPLQSGMDTSINRVVLHLPEGLTEADLDEAETTLLEQARSELGDMLLVRFDALEVFPAACTHPNCDPPLRGGVRITAGMNCTAGVNARRTSDNTRWVMTAGHCGAGTWTAYDRTGAAHGLGDSTSGVYVPAGDYRAIRVTAANTTYWQPTRKFAAWNLNDDYNLTGTGFSSVGTSVCMAGATSTAIDCGVVLELNASAGGVNGLAKASICVLDGDSGGPMFWAPTVFGLVSIGTVGCTPTSNNVMWYQGINGALSGSGLVLL